MIFLDALWAQTNLFWCEMKINNKSNTRQENFRTFARHINCSFSLVREETGLPVGLVEDEFTQQKQNEMF